jgi:hypothetical protein
MKILIKISLKSKRPKKTKMGRVQAAKGLTLKDVPQPKKAGEKDAFIIGLLGGGLNKKILGLK